MFISTTLHMCAVPQVPWHSIPSQCACHSNTTAAVQSHLTLHKQPHQDTVRKLKKAAGIIHAASKGQASNKG